ncbi:conserved Plasmodium protein, unknown function [Plasmodium knowlesi strain H]|uniref:Uncharacterized protein n=3 Tax=Plasmodium knowlesi TaxID=5850 RepID=B3L3A2_PLAKH|nr:conserved Plasmodium protein, unknown function [Plasmodium knowlesi strain H]OTN67320.1 Uncharacterized protein PKNOH_S06408500 [Plasmodium knowlesi]CAA9987360.1 conserved Plasmodium protein, unknown function [Plasmodium knowlesi strain H]SBO24500.1 conserved Plasmodium protein, unknown function [Plasmodium knowlesi strain H]VVS76834.1 conserved Plasmodium protein, unknown function [Plasmodium knowlesi strain H]|eukprot:XP_002258363.1 hypothetical protein, conserved in Plasmodium species [Plasmodium knowlesi strain H]
MPKLSYLIRKCKGKDGEKISEQEEVDAFSILNEDSCYSSDHVDMDSHVEEGWADAILADNKKNKHRQGSKSSGTNGSSAHQLSRDPDGSSKEGCKSGKEETYNEKVTSSSGEEILDNIVLSKRAHIFHSLKILYPKGEEKGETEGGETGTKGKDDEMIQLNEGLQNTDGNLPPGEGCQKQSSKLRNPLKNTYKNFTVYENKVKQMEKKKKKKNEKYDILYAKCRLSSYIDTLQKHQHVSELYNDILESINHLNKLNVREAYHHLRDVYVKKYSTQKEIQKKKFFENQFVSEILYRYKIMNKIELIFNMYVKDTWNDFFNYSVISKKVYKNFIFDYLIDLVDVNGMLCFSRYTNWTSGSSDDISASLTVQSSEEFVSEAEGEEDLKDAKDVARGGKPLERCPEKSLSEGSDGEEEYKRCEKRFSNTRDNRRGRRARKRESKRKNSASRYIDNKYIDYGHFHLAYDDEEDNEVFYFVTKKEFNSFKRIYSRKLGEGLLRAEGQEEEDDEEDTPSAEEASSDQFQTAEESEEDIGKTSDSKSEPKGGSRRRTNRQSTHKEKVKKFANESMTKREDVNMESTNSRIEERERSDLNTFIYFYVNLLIPSNFVYVIAAMIESNLFKSWIPFYSFPFKFGISECKTLKQRGMLDKIVYTKIAMPWLIKDRCLLMDVWICEDLKFSKGIFLYASNIPKNSENMTNLDLDTDSCMEIDMAIHAFIAPRTFDETVVKCYVEISPNINVNEFFISFLTKVFIKSCISHFVNACRNFQFNEVYKSELRKSNLFYDRLRKAAEECNIYET